MFSRIAAETGRPAYGQEQKTKVSCASKSSRGVSWFFTPVIAPMLQNRWLVRILAGLGFIQIVLTASGLGVWKCPIHSALGVACPGCGMTTAIAMLLEGNWEAAVRLHAFAPLVMVFLILMAISGILPIRYRNKITGAIAALESRSGITALVLIAMIAYWVLRVLEIS